MSAGTEPMSDLPKGLSQQELSENILAALVDAYGVSQIEDGSRKGWLRKFASEPRRLVGREGQLFCCR